MGKRCNQRPRRSIARPLKQRKSRNAEIKGRSERGGPFFLSFKNAFKIIGILDISSAVWYNSYVKSNIAQKEEFQKCSVCESLMVKLLMRGFYG